MPNSIKVEENVDINPRETAVQTTLTGNTVYSLPRSTAKRKMVDIMLKMMDDDDDDDGPLPMLNMRPAKKMRNAAEHFYAEHHGEYEAMGQVQGSQVQRVYNHNNACPKMYDELDKRRSTARVGMTGLAYQMALNGTPTPSGENMVEKFDPSCPKCIKRKKRIEEERKRRKRLCKKCREQRNRRVSKNNLRRGAKCQRVSKNNLRRVAKRKTTRPRKQQGCRSYSRTYKPCIVRSNKGFQCRLTAETKSVSTSKSSDNLSSVVSQEITTRNIDNSLKDSKKQEKKFLKPKSSRKKRVGKKPASIKSDVNSGQADTETEASVTSYNSFLSSEHEPMVE